MGPLWFADWILRLVAIGTAVAAGYQSVINKNHAIALQMGAISILWLSVTLINGYQDVLVSTIAIGTLVLVWLVTQNQIQTQDQ